MPRSAALLVPLLLAATAAASLVAWHEHRQLETDAIALHRAEFIAADNDRLREALSAAEREAADTRNASIRAQVERDTSAIRGLPFKQPVQFAVLDRAGIRQVIAGKLTQVFSDQEIQDSATGLAAFGLLPPNFPLKQTYIDLLGEQVAAFYDQHQHKLFMFRDADLRNAQNRVILSHELTHALQDQNFGLQKLPLEIKNDDDRALAASALIEGDATLEMNQYMAKDLTWHTLADSIGFTATQSMEQIRRAPRFLRELLVFPYLKGIQFCTAVYARGGFAALSAVYADPPASTAQILHPEEYFAGSREDPIDVRFASTDFQGEKPLADNVLGEFATGVLFSEYLLPDDAENVAAGWRGDRYLVYDHGNTLVWHTVWRTPAAADAAIRAMEQVWTRRFGLQFVRAGAGWVSNDTPGHSAMIQPAGANEVVFILATSRKSCELLSRQFVGDSHG